MQVNGAKQEDEHAKKRDIGYSRWRQLDEDIQ